MIFKKVDIADKQRYDEYLNSKNYINDNYVASELNFANLFCWNVSDNIEYCFTEQAVYVKADYEDGVIFLPPLIKRVEDFAPAVKNIENYMREHGMKFSVRSLTKEMVDVLNEQPHAYEITYNRDYSEYLYATSELAELVGKKYNQKRNHLNYFYQNYPYSFREYSTADKQSIINLVFEWKVKVGNTEILEQIAIDNALAYFEQLDLRCLVLEVNEKVEAMAIGFINRNNCAIVMFEKANANIRGCYPAINHLCAKEVFSTADMINRQEDLGIEGLRKAKLSYHPARLADKFDLTLLED